MGIIIVVVTLALSILFILALCTINGYNKRKYMFVISHYLEKGIKRRVFRRDSISENPVYITDFEEREDGNIYVNYKDDFGTVVNSISVDEFVEKYRDMGLEED